MDHGSPLLRKRTVILFSHALPWLYPATWLHSRTPGITGELAEISCHAELTLSVVRYDVNTPSQEAAGIDVYHESDLPPLYGQNNAPLATNPGPEVFNITPIIQRYYTNFVRFLNPNLPNGSANRTWPQWKPPKLVGTTGTRFRFSLDPSQDFAPVINTEQALKEQLSLCAFWRTLENKMGQ